MEEVNTKELEGDRVLTSDVTFLISHILHDNNARSAAFGESSFLNVRGHPEVSVKTGTTNDRRDNWTIGYTEFIMVVSWVGNNDNTPMSGAVSGVSGASPIWNRIITEALDKAEDGFYGVENEGHAWPRQPGEIIGATVCATTGVLPEGSTPDPGCPTRFEYFLQGTVAPTIEGGQRDIPIDKTTHAPATQETPPEQIEMQSHKVLFDPLGATYCLDCALPTQPVTIRYPLGR